MIKPPDVIYLPLLLLKWIEVFVNFLPSDKKKSRCTEAGDCKLKIHHSLTEAQCCFYMVLCYITIYMVIVL